MARDRDVAAFDARAPGYEDGWLGRLHHEIADRTAELALACVPAPHRVLDVGCGTGYLLRQLAVRVPEAAELTGIDAAPSMIEVAAALTADDRVRYRTGVAEQLPLPAGTVDLVVSTTSFDHWADQRAGLAECARVLVPRDSARCNGMTSTPSSSRRSRPRCKETSGAGSVPRGTAGRAWPGFPAENVQKICPALSICAGLVRVGSRGSRMPRLPGTRGGRR